MIITLDYQYSDAAIQRMRAPVDQQIERDVNLNGIEYTIERADYTSLARNDGGDPDEDEIKLFCNVIQPALDGR